VTLRLRVTLLAAVTVAVAIIGASVLTYFAVQRQLVDQVDSSLKNTAEFVQRVQQRDQRSGRFPPPFSRPTLISGNPFVFAQVVTPQGEVPRADAPQGASSLVVPEVKDVAGGGRPSYTGDVYVKGDSDTYHLRVYAVPFGPGQALELAKPVDDIDAALEDTRNILIGGASLGVALAAILGLLLTRAALQPVRRLTAAVEDVTRTRDLSRRVAMGGRDEIARLAGSFDAMLTALEMSLRQQRQLVADASHELRTPLTSLRTNLELLARGQPTDPDDRQQLLDELVAQMERLSTLVTDLIDLARDEEVSFPVEDLRLDEVAATAIDEMGMRYPKVVFRSDLRPVTVRGVRPRIARAVTNLLDNAAKWSPAGGVVEVSVVGGEIAVRDHGPGVAPADRPHVFDRFWRAANARHLPGSGLGLSIVKQVAEAHGGSVTVEDPPDGGARFRLRLAN
jgi:two-component system sensor histidine kinase MprB